MLKWCFVDPNYLSFIKSYYIFINQILSVLYSLYFIAISFLWIIIIIM
jgi:hypothetical protein